MDRRYTRVKWWRRVGVGVLFDLMSLTPLPTSFVGLPILRHTWPTFVVTPTLSIPPGSSKQCILSASPVLAVNYSASVTIYAIASTSPYHHSTGESAATPTILDVSVLSQRRFPHRCRQVAEERERVAVWSQAWRRTLDPFIGNTLSVKRYIPKTSPRLPEFARRSYRGPVHHFSQNRIQLLPIIPTGPSGIPGRSHVPRTAQGPAWDPPSEGASDTFPSAVVHLPTEFTLEKGVTRERDFSF